MPLKAAYQQVARQHAQWKKSWFPKMHYDQHALTAILWKPHHIDLAVSSGESFIRLCGLHQKSTSKHHKASQIKAPFWWTPKFLQKPMRHQTPPIQGSPAPVSAGRNFESMQHLKKFSSSIGVFRQQRVWGEKTNVTMIARGAFSKTCWTYSPNKKRT